MQEGCVCVGGVGSVHGSFVVNERVGGDPRGDDEGGDARGREEGSGFR